MRCDDMVTVRCFRDLLRSLERGLRGTVVGSLHSALCRARATGPKDAVPRAPEQAERGGPELVSEARALPCHLPPLPDWFVQSESEVCRSRRLRRRLQTRKLAWRLAEWQVAYCDACELGWPRDAGKALRALGPPRISGQQLLNFSELLESDLRLGRLVARPDGWVAGRGLQSLRTLVESFDHAAQEAGRDLSAFEVEKVVTSAMEVDPSRVAVQNPAGAVDPRDWIGPERAEIFEHYENRRYDGGGVPPPKGLLYGRQGSRG